MPPSRLQPHSQLELRSAFTAQGPMSIVPRIINFGGYATFCRDHMQPIKKLIWKSAQMTGQIRLPMKSCFFVKTFAHVVRLDKDQMLTPYLGLLVLPLPNTITLK